MRSDGETLGRGARHPNGQTVDGAGLDSMGTDGVGPGREHGRAGRAGIHFRRALADIVAARGKEIASNGARQAEVERLLGRMIAHEAAAK